LRGGRVDLFNGCLQWEESGRWIKVIYIYIPMKLPNGLILSILSS
jgi:hypothetical protein